MVVNARHELILTRARSDNNSIVGNPTKPEIELFKVSHVMLNEINKLSLLRTLEGGRYLSVFARGICISTFCYSTQPIIRRPLKLRLS